MNLLIKNIDIINTDGLVKFIGNVNIGITDGYIEYVSHPNEPIKDFKADRIIDGKNRIAMPGLVNSHTHCAMTILRNFADDLALEEWLFRKIFPAEAKLSEEDIYWGTLLGIIEMIKSGTTAFADMYLHMDAVAQAVTESGMRANISISPLKFNVGEKSETIEETEKCFEFHKRWNNSAAGRLKVSLEVHSAYLFNEESLKNAAEIAKQLNMGIQIHILETEKEREDIIKRYGKSSVEVCDQWGIFDVPVIAAHCVHLSEVDMDILKLRRVNVAHNPTSNLKLGSGVANVPHMLKKGINVALGTDGTASNNNLNMFEEMHIAALLHKGVLKNPQLISAAQAIEMATVNGSRAIGFGDVSGCIKKGMKADLIILDTDKTHFCPMNDPISAMVYCAQGSDVDAVIVDGNILMENREIKLLDEEKVKNKVREISKRVLQN